MALGGMGLETAWQKQQKIQRLSGALVWGISPENTNCRCMMLTPRKKPGSQNQFKTTHRTSKALAMWGEACTEVSAYGEGT